jgi:HEAT repeat protein
MKVRRFAVSTVQLLVAAVFFATAALAGEPTLSSSPLPDAKVKIIESNLVAALESKSPTLQASAAQVIRELKQAASEYNYSRSVIPLMRILKDESVEAGVRQVAALALHEIGSERGDYAIKKEGLLSHDQQLKRLCLWLTYARMTGGVPTVAESLSVAIEPLPENIGEMIIE